MTNRSTREIRYCAWHECGLPIEVTQGQLERSRTGKFCCGLTTGRNCRALYTAYCNRKIERSRCAWKNCPKLAARGGKYCGRAHAGEAKTKKRIQLECCVEGCSNIKEYHPSTVPKTGRCFCEEHYQSKDYTPKPRRGETRTCELGPDCVNPKLIPENRPGQFYARPSSTQMFCSIDCNNHARVKGEFRECAWKGIRNEVPIHMFWVCPSQDKPYQRVCCGAEHNSLNRIKRPLDRIHNGKPAKLDDDDYVWIWEPEHPKSPVYKGWIQEHVYVAEQIIGGPLPEGAEVHHENRIHWDNDPSNLTIEDPISHSRLTAIERRTDRERSIRLTALEQALQAQGVDPDSLIKEMNND